MNLRPYILLAILFSLFLETTVITFPLVYIAALVLYILYPDIRSIIAGSVAGLILDMLKIGFLGSTTISLLTSFLFLELLKRVLELKDYRLVIVIIGVLSFIYARTFSYTENILLYIGVFGISGFLIFYFHKKSLW